MGDTHLTTTPGQFNDLPYGNQQAPTAVTDGTAGGLFDQMASSPSQQYPGYNYHPPAQDYSPSHVQAVYNPPSPRYELPQTQP